MEKQRINAKSRFIKRLLIFVFLILNVNSSIFSQYLTYSIIKDLRITPVENQDLYANTEIKFEATRCPHCTSVLEEKVEEVVE